MPPNNEINLPSNWQELDSDARDSTIAWFVSGWINDEGEEVLIWQGVKEEGEYHIETHLHDEAPDEATHVIEVLKPKDDADTKDSSNPKDKELQEELFAETPSEAVEKALNYIRG